MKQKEHPHASRKGRSKMTAAHNGIIPSEMDKIVLSELSFYSYQSLLNISCGKGSLLALIPRRKGVFLAGIDHIEERLREVSYQSGEKVELHCGTALKLPWKDHHFDMVLCTHSCHIARQPGEGLQEIKRILKPGGRLIMTAPWRPSPVRQVINLYKSILDKQHAPIYSEPEYTTMLKECGFENIKWIVPTRRTCMVVAQSAKV